MSLTGIIDSALKVGLVTGLVREGSKLSRQLVDSLGRCERVGEKVRVYLEIDFNGPVSFGAYSYITDAIRFLGGDNIHGEQFCEWLTPDLEHVKRLDPDVILYEAKMFSRFSESDLAEVVRSRGWESLRAVKNGNTFLAPGPLDFFAHHGPSFITGVLPWMNAKLEAADHG